MHMVPSETLIFSSTVVLLEAAELPISNACSWILQELLFAVQTERVGSSQEKEGRRWNLHNEGMETLS